MWGDQMATANPTADDYIDLLPSELGVTVYIEIIIIESITGVANVGFNTACARSCDAYSGFRFSRDLLDLGRARTVKELLNLKGRRTADFIPYYRDYNTNTLRAAAYADALSNRKSVIFVSTGLSVGQVRVAMEHIGTHREVLPSRLPK